MGDITNGISTDKEAQRPEPRKERAKETEKQNPKRWSTGTTGFCYAGLSKDPRKRGSGDVLCVIPWGDTGFKGKRKKGRRGTGGRIQINSFFL